MTPLDSVDHVENTDDDGPAGGVPDLEVPPEPEELRTALRDAVLAGGDWRAGFPDDLCIGSWLWDRWEPRLEPAGCTREDAYKSAGYDDGTSTGAARCSDLVRGGHIVEVWEADGTQRRARTVSGATAGVWCADKHGKPRPKP